jgi:hypothetical protein
MIQLLRAGLQAFHILIILSLSFIRGDNLLFMRKIQNSFDSGDIFMQKKPGSDDR